MISPRPAIRRWKRPTVLVLVSWCVAGLVVAGAAIGFPPPRAAAESGVAPDPFGGLPVRVADPAGFFRVKKVDNRWMFVTPAGNAFWMLGVFAADVDTRFIDLEAKYGGRPTWGVQVTRRMKAWGFNTLAEYASAYVLPGKPNVEKLPFVVMIRPSFYGLRNYGGHAPGPVR